jgi:hypothetical protein
MGATEAVVRIIEAVSWPFAAVAIALIVIRWLFKAPSERSAVTSTSLSASRDGLTLTQTYDLSDALPQVVVTEDDPHNGPQ